MLVGGRGQLEQRDEQEGVHSSLSSVSEPVVGVGG